MWSEKLTLGMVLFPVHVSYETGMSFRVCMVWVQTWVEDRYGKKADRDRRWILIEIWFGHRLDVDVRVLDLELLTTLPNGLCPSSLIAF